MMISLLDSLVITPSQSAEGADTSEEPPELELNESHRDTLDNLQDASATDTGTDMEELQ